ncbi:chymotrypsin inhibitor SCI-III [Drosophila erecta]|uniref:chymotrypsin inhibitor SCI-III n=1 Tax=Drosophila erecta TaxID=7220 RepID=UPI000F055D4C|nr:chymotrypsin inhibitor SCI-III [Drosophila erecta]
MRLVIPCCLILALQTVGLCLKDPICGQQPAKNGDRVITCIGSFDRYSYHPRIQSCLKFDYGGCNGNDNNFKTLQECEQKCKPENCTHSN